MLLFFLFIFSLVECAENGDGLITFIIPGVVVLMLVCLIFAGVATVSVSKSQLQVLKQHQAIEKMNDLETGEIDPLLLQLIQNYENTNKTH